jgi:hypothetical protein
MDADGEKIEQVSSFNQTNVLKPAPSKTISQIVVRLSDATLRMRTSAAWDNLRRTGCLRFP